jgi:hypothetical protein
VAKKPVWYNSDALNEVAPRSCSYRDRGFGKGEFPMQPQSTMPLPDTWAYLRSQVYLRDQGICALCKAFVPLARYECGHLVDATMGGQPTLENCVVMCGPCNLAKPFHSTREEALEWLAKGVPSTVRRGPLRARKRANGKGSLYFDARGNHWKVAVMRDGKRFVKTSMDKGVAEQFYQELQEGLW